MSRGEVLPSTRHRVLPDPGIRAICADRDSVVGVVLDQHGVVAGTSVYRSVNGTHDVDHEWRSQGHSTSSLLYQGKSHTQIDILGTFLIYASAARR